MIYNLSYDDIVIARVEITDTITSQVALTDMVEFWSGWESRLEQAQGSHLTAWLIMLTRYIILNGKAPCDEEGWVPLDGTHHIWLRSVCPWEPNDELIIIDEEST
jgi:hypothetical protein